MDLLFSIIDVIGWICGALSWIPLIYGLYLLVTGKEGIMRKRWLFLIFLALAMAAFLIKAVAILAVIILLILTPVVIGIGPLWVIYKLIMRGRRGRTERAATQGDEQQATAQPQASPDAPSTTVVRALPQADPGTTTRLLPAVPSGSGSGDTIDTVNLR